MSEFPARPADDYFETAAPLRKRSPEQPKPEPASYIETYFTSPQGHGRMEDLIYAIDGAAHGSNTKGIPGKINEILQHPDKDLGQLARLLLSTAGVDGLNSPQYGQAFRDNPAMTICRHLIDKAHHDGLDDMASLYGSTLTILANITRYQLFDGSYDPESDEWLNRAQHMVYLREGNYTQYLPTHPDNPAYSRES